MPATTATSDDDRCPDKTVFPLTAFANEQAVHSWLKDQGYAATDYQLARQTDGAWIAYDPDGKAPPSGAFDIDVVDGALIHYEPPAAPAAAEVATKGYVHSAKADFSAAGNAYVAAPGTEEPTEAERIAKLPPDVRDLVKANNLSAHNAEQLAMVMRASSPIPADRISAAALLHLRGLHLIQERADGALGRRTVEPGLATKAKRATASKSDSTDLATLAARPRAPVAAKSDAPISRGLLGGLLGTRG